LVDFSDAEVIGIAKAMEKETGRIPEWLLGEYQDAVSGNRGFSGGVTSQSPTVPGFVKAPAIPSSSMSSLSLVSPNPNAAQQAPPQGWSTFLDRLGNI
jgi:hypothetical protein